MPAQPTRTYEALLSQPEHIAHVRAAKHAIEAIGGAVEVIPQRQTGMTLVVLTLPLPYPPETFFPGLPFYLV